MGLQLGLRRSVITGMAGFAASESVITSLAGFAFAPPPATRRPHRNPGRFQVGAGGFPTDAGRLLDAPQRPAQPSQSYDLLFLLFVQDIGHADGGYKPLPESMSRTLFSLAGFQVILIGRFWVIAEGVRSAETKAPRGVARRVHSGVRSDWLSGYF